MVIEKKHNYAAGDVKKTLLSAEKPPARNISWYEIIRVEKGEIMQLRRHRKKVAGESRIQRKHATKQGQSLYAEKIGRPLLIWLLL